MQNIPWAKIKALQEEAKILQNPPTKKKMVNKNKRLSIEGMIKGVKFTEKEIKEAQRVIFSHSSSHFE